MKTNRAKLVLFFFGFFLISGVYAYYKNQSIVSSETLEQKQTEASPTPEDPSEKALKIAAFAWARVSDDEKAELRSRYDGEELDDVEFLRWWALKMDEDPALMAKNEALMEKIIAQENQPIYYYEQSSTNPVINIDDVQNQLDRQEKELENLQDDLKWDCIRNGGVPVGNMCM